MKSKKIQKLFVEYLNSLGSDFRYANNEEMPALIYGSDQFKIDTRKSRIRIDIIGWVKAKDIDLDLDLKAIEWIAITRNEEGYNLIVSSDLNPFAESEDNPMYIDGQVFGVPAEIESSNFIYD